MSEFVQFCLAIRVSSQSISGVLRENVSNRCHAAAIREYLMFIREEICMYTYTYIYIYMRISLSLSLSLYIYNIQISHIHVYTSQDIIVAQLNYKCPFLCVSYAYTHVCMSLSLYMCTCVYLQQ